jgi:hypothetical protein
MTRDIGVRGNLSLLGAAVLFIGTVALAARPQEAPPTSPPPSKPAPSDDAATASKIVAGPVLLTVVNAEIAPMKPTGEPWHPPGSKIAGNAISAIAAAGTTALLGLPGAVQFIAGAAFMKGDDPRRVPARSGPAPFVRLSWNNERIVTPAQWNTVLPSWEYRMIIDPPADGLVTLTVIDLDFDGDRFIDDPIGTLLVEPEKFRQRGVLELGPFGALKSITFVVAPCTDDLKTETKGIVIDGTKAWTKTGVNVVAGQTVTITATGGVAANGRESCGPEGFPLPRWRNYSLLKESPHCGLVGRLGEDGPPVFVGRGGTYKMTGSGEFYFGPNDRDLGNNKGEFKVDISVR